MAFNGSGTFLRVMNWTADAQADIDIRSDRHDTQDDDFAAGLSNAITRDGQSQPTADLPMNGHKITNLGAPVNDKDAATKLYADTPKPYNTGVEIAGADLNGMVNFTSLTGANGLSWKGADLAWLARLATAAGPGTPPVPPATLNRLVLNDKPDGSGTDVVTINDDGSVDVGVINVRGPATFQTSAAFVGVLTAGGLAVRPAAVGPSALTLYDTDGTTVRATLSVPSAGGNATLVNGAQTFTFNNGGWFRAPAQVYAGGSSYLNTDGNIGGGGVWANWGASDAFNAISARIENRAQAWANSAVAGAVTSTRMAGEVSVEMVTNHGHGKENFAGYVMTGVAGTGGSLVFYWRQPQVYYPSQGWLAAFNF